MIFRPISFVFWALWIGLGIVVAVDAGKYPDWAFTQAGSRKSTWQIWPIVLGVLCGLGTLIMMIIWFASKKPAIARIAAGGGSPYGAPGYGAPGYGAPPPGYGYPQPGAVPPPPPGWAPPAQAPPPGAPPPPPPGSAAPPPTWGTPPPAAPPTWGTEPPPPAAPEDPQQ